MFVVIVMEITMITMAVTFFKITMLMVMIAKVVVVTGLVINDG